MQEDSCSFRYVNENVPVEELGLSVRSTNALQNNGIQKLSQLLKATEESLFSLRNLGVKSVREILAAQTFYSEQFEISAEATDIELPEPAAPEPNRFLNNEGVFCEDIPLSSLGLSVRSYNCLKRGGYESASQLIGVTREDLLKINGKSKPLTEDEKAVLRYFRDSPYSTKSDLAVSIGKSVTTVNRIVKRLTERGLLKRVGSNKSGYWMALSSEA